MLTYIATNTITGKFYIGSTINFKYRKRDHMCSKYKYPFQNSLRRNPDAFIWEIFEDDSDTPILEQALLDMWFGKEQCYNINPKASIPPNLKGHKFSEETLKKRGLSRKGKNYGLVGKGHGNYGKPHTKEAIEKNRQKHLGNRWINDGEKEVPLPRGKSIPEGYVLGRLFTQKGYFWWVNEKNETTKSKYSPGPEWKRGREWK